jgi:nicotinamidase/pyrazinamidase
MFFDLVIDVQNDFMRPTGKLYVPGAETLIAPLQAHIAAVGGDQDTAHSLGIVFTYDTHLPEVYETSEEAKSFPIHCIKDSDGWQLAVDPSVARVPIYKMEKGVFDMWHEPGPMILFYAPPPRIPTVDRDLFFHNMQLAGVHKIRVVGVAADYCVEWAIDGLLARGFEVEVIGRLTVGIERTIEQVVADKFADRAVTIT